MDRPTGPATIADALAAEHPGRDRGDAPHRQGGSAARTSTACSTRSRWTESISSARWTRTSRTTRSTCPRSTAAAANARRGHRLALSERRQRRQLAAAPDLSQHVRQPLHPRRDAAVGERLHQRLPLLAARGAGAVAARRRWSRTATPSSSRCCSTPPGSGCRFGEVPIIFVERRQGQSKLSSGVILESVMMPWRLKLPRRR